MRRLIVAVSVALCAAALGTTGTAYAEGNNATGSTGTVQVGGGNTSTGSTGAVQSAGVTTSTTGSAAGRSATVPVTIPGSGNTASGSTGAVQVGGGNTATGSTGAVQTTSPTTAPQAGGGGSPGGGGGGGGGGTVVVRSLASARGGSAPAAPAPTAVTSAPRSGRPAGAAFVRTSPKRQTATHANLVSRLRQAVTPRGTLPFTGLGLLAFLIGALSLALLGAFLRSGLWDRA